MYKIGLIGNSCTGKGTAAFTLLRFLKFNNALTGYCADLCRFLPFPPDALDTNPLARLHVLFSQFAAECTQACRHDCDYIITERTVLDWWLYYRWTCHKCDVLPQGDVDSLIKYWLGSYDLFFWLNDEGMVYIKDGYRPATTTIRDEMVEYYGWAKRWMIANHGSRIRMITVPDVRQRCQEVEKLFAEWFESHKIQRRQTPSDDLHQDLRELPVRSSCA